jgi:hypothetical protein
LLQVINASWKPHNGALVMMVLSKGILGESILTHESELPVAWGKPLKTVPPAGNDLSCGLVGYYFGKRREERKYPLEVNFRSLLTALAVFITCVEP